MSSAPILKGCEKFHSLPRNVLARRTIIVEHLDTPRGKAVVPPGSWLVFEEIGNGLVHGSVIPDDAFAASFVPGWVEPVEQDSPEAGEVPAAPDQALPPNGSHLRLHQD